MKHKVLLFVQDGVGGAERMSVLIGKSLKRDNYSVCFCLIQSSVKSTIKDFIPDDIRSVSIHNGGAFSLMLNMARVLIKEKPDVVFSSVFNLSNKLLLLKWIVPHSRFIIRCDNYIYTYNEKQQRILRKTYPKADVLIAQTEEMGEELIEQAKVSAAKVKVLHNPIDKSLIDKKLIGKANPYLENGRKHFVAVGRFNQQKGFDLLINAFIKVCYTRKDIDLHIVGDTTVGDGVVAKSVRNAAEKAGFGDLVHFDGYQKNPYPFLKFADSFVLSSRWEGLPNVLIEALYLGTPVAAFKCIPIIERIVDDGVTGFLAEKENVDDLSTAMLKAIDMGRVVSNYQSAKVSDFTDLFDKVIIG